MGNIYQKVIKLLLYWNTNKPEYHKFDVHNNIFLVVKEKLMGG